MYKYVILMMLAVFNKVLACDDTIFFNGFAESLNSESDVSRLLNQSTFGGKENEIRTVQYLGLEKWIDMQLCEPATLITSSLEQTKGQLLPARLNLNWQAFIKAPDQLRQRVAFALSQIMVVSQLGYECGECPIGIANYHDMLVENAFGNFRDLLEEVSLNPTMGFYLSMLGNAKADEVLNTRADENFARELMQLFSIGLVMLNPDGTIELDEFGSSIPTYDIAHIKDLAKILTGWHWANTPSWQVPVSNQLDQMTPYIEEDLAPYHDYSEKNIIGHQGVESTTFIPEGLSPVDDVNFALDTIFNHPNVGPFISKQLIQKLVTSNPSPEYVSRITNVFNDDGSGIRGNLGAVVKSILLDEEARNVAYYQSDVYGKLREPILRLTHLWRVFDAELNYQGVPTDFIFLAQQLNQSPYQSASVFNFYRPDHQSNDIENVDIFGPVFQLNSESNLINYQNLLRSLTVFGFTGGSATNFQNVVMDGEKIRSWLLESEEHFVNQLNLLFFGNNMTASLQNNLINLLHEYAQLNGEPNQISTEDLTIRAAITLYLAISTPEYLIQK